MFAQITTLNLKPDYFSKFTETFENQIVPMFRKQKGFRDELTLLSPSKIETISISLWDTKEDADSFNRDVYPTMLSNLTNVLEGTPRVKTYEVSNSTFHKIGALVTA